jgi:uncharacterized protein (TIGR02594 family)
MSDLPWVAEAEKYIGVAEIKGDETQPLILKWWKAIRLGGVRDDETPWCAAFVGGCLEAVDIRSTSSGLAKSYLKWGVEIVNPIRGCIVVFSRDGGGGHIGIVMGQDAKGRLMVLGGNQGNKVSIAPFDRSRVLGFRWPASVAAPIDTLPELLSVEASSSKEA